MENIICRIDIKHKEGEMFEHRINRIGKTGVLFTIILLISALFFWDYSFADVPQQIFFQARLSKKDGRTVSGSHSIAFNLYTASTGGSSLWTETQTLTADASGIISCYLGSSTAFTSTIDFNSTYYLSINVDADGEMSPRIKLVPALAALNADRFDGLNSTQFLRSDTADTMEAAFTLTSYFDQDYTGTAADAMNINFNPSSGSYDALDITYGSSGGTGTALKVTQSGSGDILQLYDGSTGILAVKDGGNVGIGTTSPAGLLQVGTSPNAGLVVTAAGSVGIGVTTPTGRLDIRGDEVRIWTGEGTNTNATSSGELYVEGDLEVDGTLYTASQSVTGNLLPSAADTYDLGSTTAEWKNLYLGTGKLYFGTAQDINLYRSSTDTLKTDDTFIASTALVTPKLYPSSDSTTAVQINKADGTTNVLNVDTTNARLGIGTTAPGNKLAVSGYVGIGTTSPSSEYLSTQAPDGGMIIEGRVGIGTTSPGYALDVNGTARLSGNLTLDSGVSILPAVSGGSDLGSSTYKINNLYVNTINASSSTSTGQAVFTYAPTSNAIAEGAVYINPTTATSGRPLLSIAVGGVEKARITTDGYLGLNGVNDPGTSYILNAGSTFNIGTGGNVGIGETSPGSLLSVKGGISVGETTDYSQKTAPTGGMLIKGDVGIGTTLPTAVLHLKAGTTAANSAPLKFTSGSSLTTAEAGAMEFDGTYLYFSPSNGTRKTIAFTDGAGVDHGGLSGLGDDDHTQYLLADGSRGLSGNWYSGNYNIGSLGSVGVGNTAPSAKLEVKGAGTGTTFALKIQDGDGNDKVSFLDNGNVGIGTTAPAGLLQVGTLPNSALTVLASGNVGIGTTNPSTYNLTVEGSIQGDDYYSGDGTQGASDTTGGVTFKDGLYTSGTIVTCEWTDAGSVIYPSEIADYVGIGNTAPEGLLDVGTIPGKGLIVLTNGYVGIGTTNPTTQLYLTGDITIAGDNIEATTETDRFVWMANGSTYAPEAIDLGTDTTGNYAAGDNEAGNALTGDSATAFFSSGAIEHEYGGLEANVSAYSGLVGINSGATSEVDTESELETHLGGLDVVTVTTDDITSANLATAVSDETGTGALVFGTSPNLTTPNAYGQFDIIGAGTGATFALRISNTTPTDRLVVLDNGNVGIGTTSPGADLEIYNLGGAEAIRFDGADNHHYMGYYDNGNLKFLVGYDDVNNKYAISRTDPRNAPDFYVDSAGNTVVVGTLTVNGNQTGAADHVFDDYDDMELLHKWREGKPLPFETGDMLNRDRLLRDTIIQLEKRVHELEKLVIQLTPPQKR